LCDWATCNLRLHFSGTLLGSARRTGLLPVCGRNLYNYLCSFFLCSFHLSTAQRLWTHSDSELLQTLNLRTVLQNVRKKFSKTQFNPPFLWFFSPSYFIFGIPFRTQRKRIWFGKFILVMNSNDFKTFLSLHIYKIVCKHF